MLNMITRRTLAFEYCKKLRRFSAARSYGLQGRGLPQPTSFSAKVQIHER